MENFLIFSGALAMIVGLLAIIEGSLLYFGIIRPKEGSPQSPRWTTRNLPG
jgi:hypothetical protein